MRVSTVFYFIIALLFALSTDAFAQYDVSIGSSASNGGSWDDSGNPAVWTADGTNIYSPPFHTVNKDEIVSRLNAGISVTILSNSSLYLMDSVAIRKTSGGDATLKFLSSTTTVNKSWISIGYATSNGGYDTISSTSGKLNIIFNADGDGNGDGFIKTSPYSGSTNCYFSSNGGDIIFGGGSDPYTTSAYGYPSGYYGVYLQGVHCYSDSGQIIIRGNGTGDKSGVELGNSSVFQSSTGNVTIVGAGGNSSTPGYGVTIYSDNTTIQTTDGTITVTGTGGTGTSTTEPGLRLSNASKILSTNGNINLTGTGGSGPTGYGYGVWISGYYVNDPLIQTSNGTITINANGGATSGAGSTYGMLLEDGGSIGATGTGAITITATGGTGGSTNNGLRMTHGQSTPGYIQTNSGNISITATAGSGSAGGSTGLYMYSYGGGATSAISSTSGTIDIHATSKNGGHGIEMSGEATVIQSSNNVTIIADTSGSGYAGNGIFTGFGSDIKTTGTGNLTITAIGSGVGGTNHGIYLSGGGSSIIATEDGALNISSYGGGNSANGNHGIELSTNSYIYSRGGKVTVNSTAGFGGYGVYMNSSSYIEADSSSLFLTATGTGSGFGFGLYKSDGIGLLGSLYGDTCYIKATGSGTGLALDGYGGMTIGSSTFPGELIIEADASTSDQINLSVFTIRGIGRLTLRPLLASTTIGIAQTGSFNLSTSDLAVIQDGFKMITIGRSDGTGQIMTGPYSGTLTFSDSLTILSNTGNIFYDGSINVGTNSLTFTTNGGVQGGGVNRILTAGTLTLNGSGFASSILIPTVDNLNLNTTTVVLNSNTQVNNQLNINSSHVRVGTGGFILTLGTGTLNTGAFSSTGGQIEGKFSRWVTDTTSSVTFPLSNSTNKDKGITLSYSTPPTTGGTITARWVPGNPGTNGLPLSEGGWSIPLTETSGYWTVDSGNGLSGGTYGIDFSNENVSYTQAAKVRMLQRANSSSNWSLQGTHSDATTSSGISHGHRTGLTAYGQFGWGQAVGSATALSTVSGNNQIGSLNSALVTPFKVKAADADGAGAPSETVTFAIVDSPYAATGHSLSSYSTTTNNNGEATTTLTLGNKAGRYMVTATSGSLTGSPQTFTAMAFDQTAGNALMFDGSNDVIAVPASDSINLSVGTWEAWVKLNTLSHHNRIIFKEGADQLGKYELYALDSNNGNAFKADVVVGLQRYTATASGVSATSGTWYHLAATFDGTNLKIYVNGTLRGTTAVAGTIDANTGPLGIGGNVSGTLSSTLEGTLDEVRIWRVARTESEIQADMHKSYSSSQTNLAAYWQFTEGSGSSTAVDVVNGNVGTLTNMNTTSAWTTSTIPFGLGTTTTASNFSSGTASLGDLSFTTTDALDNAVSLASRSYTVAPDSVPSGTVLSNQYWSVDAYGDPGTFSANVTFTVPSSFTNNNTNFLSQYKLYHRSFGGDGSWTLLNSGANSATSTTVTFNGVTQFGQFELATTTVATDSTPGYALKFDGVDDYVNAGSGVNIADSSFTVEFWAKRSANSAGYIFSQGIASENQGLHIGWNTSSQLRFDFYGLEALNVSLSYDTLWHHWAFTYNAATNGRKIFLDGAVIAADAPANDYSGSGTLYLGRRFDSGQPQFAGSLDEVRVWNSALDSTSIRQQMHRIYTTPVSGMLAQWQFAEGSGTTVNDPVNANNGTLVNVNFNASSGWSRSTITAGVGTSASASAFTTGTANLSMANLSLTTTNDFDNAVELTATAISVAPNVQPTGVASTLSDRYWVLDKFNDGGSFSANLTFTVPSSFTSGVPNSFYKLYSREGNSDTAWVLVTTGAASSTSTSVTFNGITSFSQFALGKADTYPFDTTAGYALSFDGTNDYVTLPISSSPHSYTIEMWVKPAVTTNANIFVRTDAEGDQNGAFSHQLRIENGVFVHYLYDEGYYGSIGLSGTTQVVANQWYHIAIVAGDYNGGSPAMQLYVNGVKEADMYDTYGDYPYQLWSGGTLYMLGSNGGGLPNFQGTIDEVKIWNYVRTADQIRSDMHRTQFGAPSGLITYYQLNQGSGTSATDIMSGYNGTLTNGPTWTTSTAPLGKGTATSSTSFSTGTASLGSVSLTMTDDFDNPVDLYTTAISVAPNALPSGSSTTLSDRYWIVNTFGMPGTFSGNLTFTVPSTFTNNGTAAASNYTLYRRNSNDEGGWTAIATGASLTATSVTFNGITSFSQFAIGTNDPLPVELVSVSAAVKQNNVELHWKTATELNSHGFEIQRMTSSQTLPLQGGGQGGGWQRVGFIEGSGNSNAPKEYSFADAKVTNGKYEYRLKLVDRDGSFKYSQSVEAEVKFIPTVFALSQNYPNPFNPSTTINYQLPKNSYVTLKVYDILGKEVTTLVDEMKEAGSYDVQLNAQQFASGVYFYRIHTRQTDGGANKDFVQLKKMVLIK